MTQNLYMAKTEALLREGKATLENLRLRTAKAGEERAEAKRKLAELEARYAEVSRRFEQLRAAGTVGLADIKVGLEKAWDAFQTGTRHAGTVEGP